MTENRIAIFVVSVSSVLVWDILTRLGIIGGKIQTVLIVLSLIPFLYSSFMLLNDYKFESSYFKFIFSLFISYQLVTILRGWTFSYSDIKVYMQTSYVLWPFVIPLFVFFDKRIVTFGIFFKWIYYSGFFFLLIACIVPSLLLRRLTAETYIGFFVPCGFLLLNATYLKDRKVNLAFIVIFISILALTYLARRSGLASLVGFLVTAYFLNLMNNSKSKIFRFFPVIAIICAFLLFSQFFENSKEILFNKIELRLTEDTRSGVYERFFDYLRNDMLFGNGMNGMYYCPLWDAEVDGVFYRAIEYRNIIENGYFQLLLTGGIVHIVLFVLVLLPAAFLGIFMSSNQFVKACAIVILLRLTDMFLYGVPSFTLSYMLVWICVGVCYKTSLRTLTDNEIRIELKKIKEL